LSEFRRGATYNQCSDIFVQVPKEDDLNFQYFGAKATGITGAHIHSGIDGNGNPVKLVPGLVAMTQAGEKGVDALMFLNAKLNKIEEHFGYKLFWFNQDKKLQRNVGNGKESENTLDNSEIKKEFAKMKEMLTVYTKQFKVASHEVIGVFDIFSDKPAPTNPDWNMAEVANIRYVITRGGAFTKVAGPVFGPFLSRDTKRMRIKN